MTFKALFSPACLKISYAFSASESFEVVGHQLSSRQSYLTFNTLRSISVVLALTKPVLSVMFFIQRSSRLKLTGFPMHSDVGNMTADRDYILADIEGCWIAHTFHGDIDTTAIGHFIDKGLDFINIT